MIHRWVLLPALLLSLSVAATGQSTWCDSIRELKQQTYGFKFSELRSWKLRDSISKQVIRFWRAIGPDRINAVGCVKEMVAGSSDSYFLIDASHFLLMVDSSRKSIESAARIMQQVDPDQAPLSDYESILLYLSRHDIDIGSLAVRYIGLKEENNPPQELYPGPSRLEIANLLFGSMSLGDAERHLGNALRSSDPMVFRSTVGLLLVESSEGSLRMLDSLNKAHMIPPSVRAVIDNIIGRKSLSRIKELVAGPQELSRDQILELLHQIPRYGYSAALDTAVGMPSGSAGGNSRGTSNDADIPIDQKINRQDTFNFDDFDATAYRSAFHGFANRQELLANALATLRPEDIVEVYKARRRSVTDFLIQASTEYASLTALIYLMIVRHNLYAEYRTGW